VRSVFSVNYSVETGEDCIKRIQDFVQDIRKDIKPAVCKDCIIYANCSMGCNKYVRAFNKEERRKLAVYI